MHPVSNLVPGQGGPTRRTVGPTCVKRRRFDGGAAKGCRRLAGSLMCPGYATMLMSQ